MSGQHHAGPRDECPIVAHVGRDHGAAGGHSLQERQRKPFNRGWKHEGIDAAQNVNAALPIMDCAERNDSRIIRSDVSDSRFLNATPGNHQATIARPRLSLEGVNQVEHSFLWIEPAKISDGEVATPGSTEARRSGNDLIGVHAIGYHCDLTLGAPH